MMLLMSKIQTCFTITIQTQNIFDQSTGVTKISVKHNRGYMAPWN